MDKLIERITEEEWAEALKFLPLRCAFYRADQLRARSSILVSEI